MQQHRAMQSVTRLGLFLCVFLMVARPGYAAELTQRDWMINLVDALAKNLLGVEQSEAPGPRDLDRLTTLLATFGVER